jgi:hypothetical protein
VNKLIVFFAKLSFGSTIIFNLIKEFVIGFGVEIGLKLLNNSNGPAINNTMNN